MSEHETHIFTGRAIIFDERGFSPVIKRRPNAKNNPNLWEFAGGSIDEADIYEGIRREVKQEIDLEIEFDTPLYEVENRPLDRGLTGRYLAVCALAHTVEPAPSMKPQREEVARCEWMRVPQILKLDLTPVSRAAINTFIEYGVIDTYYPGRFGWEELQNEWAPDIA